MKQQERKSPYAHTSMHGIHSQTANKKVKAHNTKIYKIMYN